MQIRETHLWQNGIFLLSALAMGTYTDTDEQDNTDDYN
jgi:hypothetical protein